MEKLTVDLGDRSYPIYIDLGLLLNEDILRQSIKNKNVLIVTNETIAPLYLDSLTNVLSKFCTVNKCILPDGEQFKTLESFNTVLTSMLTNSMGRDSTVVALGGGVVGDISGFSASAYQRGVDFIQVPTTLLSQVDSSVGGKTGVNHKLGKNMIGAFYQPRSVVIDINTLKTLPKREISAGLAEVIKYGIIWDSEFFSFLESNIEQLLNLNASILAKTIKTCCSIKADVVHQDEKEGGIRALLNLGHTFGHAIEAFMGYGNWLHGEAVGLGMVLSAKLSFNRKLITEEELNRIINLISKAGLKTDVPSNMNYKDFMSLMKHDKKVKSGVIRYIIPTKIGTAKIVSDISEDEIKHLIGG